MSTPLLPDALRNLIQPMLPSTPPHPNAGRPRLQDRRYLIGILFVLRNGIPWGMLETNPSETNHDVHIDADGLIGHNREWSGCRTDMLGHTILNI